MFKMWQSGTLKRLHVLHLHNLLSITAPAGTQNAMGSSEVWLRDYETAKQLADDTLAMIQVAFVDLHLSLSTVYASRTALGTCI